MPARKRTTNTTKAALEAIENLSGLASPVRPAEGMDLDDAMRIIRQASSDEDPIRHKGEDCTPRDLAERYSGSTPARAIRIVFYGTRANQRGTLEDMALERQRSILGRRKDPEPAKGDARGSLDPDKIVSDLDALSLREGLSLRAYAAKLREIAEALLERANMADEEAYD